MYKFIAFVFTFYGWVAFAEFFYKVYVRYKLSSAMSISHPLTHVLFSKDSIQSFSSIAIILAVGVYFLEFSKKLSDQKEKQQKN